MGHPPAVVMCLWATQPNLFYQNGDNIQGLGTYQQGTFVQYVLTDVNVSSTPEPGSLFLLGSGLVGIGGTLRKKFLK